MKRKLCLRTFLFVLATLSTQLCVAQDFLVYTQQSIVGDHWYLEVLVQRTGAAADRYLRTSLAFEFGVLSGLDLTNPPTDASSEWTDLTSAYGSPDITTQNFGVGNPVFPKYAFVDFYSAPFSWSNCVSWPTGNVLRIVRLSLPIADASENSECSWHSTLGVTSIVMMTQGGIQVGNDRTSSTPSQFADIPGATPLPVELALFRAEQNNSQVRLYWETASELKNYGFDVERRSESGETGRLGTREWRKIVFVEGHGTSSAPHQYVYNDDNPGPGTYSYRLKQIDLDGSFCYSKEVEITINSRETAFTLHQNYPNPFNPSTSIEFSTPTSGHATLNMYNLLGQRIATIFRGDVASGTHSVEWSPTNLASGVYVYRLEVDNGVNHFTATRRLILMR
jgi:hypothetical protein